MQPKNDLALTDWLSLMIIALVAMPVAGMIAALLTLDVTRSLEAHVLTAAALPALVVLYVARRFGASGGVAVRFALLAAMFALVLLDLGWSGAFSG